MQVRGEYLYAAMGEGGFRIFDIANIDNKDISERMVTAPVSPLGQRFYVPTKYATAVATPDYAGRRSAAHPSQENEEQPIHLMYGFLYVADKYEGLVIVGNPDLKSKSPGVGTLLDGNPANNFLKRALAFNPDGVLNGARRITIAGTYAYVLCDRGLVVVDLDNPLAAQDHGGNRRARSWTIRAASPSSSATLSWSTRRAESPGRHQSCLSRSPCPARSVPLEDARNIYVARTYAYVAAGKQGMAIVDVEHPEQPRLDQIFNAGGKLNDANDVKLGMVSSSLFAYVADGVNGLKVVQLFSPVDNPAFGGFSPRPTPKLIASYRTRGPALAVSKGIDRDRAVDESGNQLAVFGRRGARPFNRQEMERMYLKNGQLFTVSDDQPSSPGPETGSRASSGSGSKSNRALTAIDDARPAVQG